MYNILGMNSFFIFKNKTYKLIETIHFIINVRYILKTNKINIHIIVNFN